MNDANDVMEVSWTLIRYASNKLARCDSITGLLILVIVSCNRLHAMSYEAYNFRREKKTKEKKNRNISKIMHTRIEIDDALVIPRCSTNNSITIMSTRNCKRKRGGGGDIV